MQVKTLLGKSFVGVGQLARRQKNDELSEQMFANASEIFAEMIQNNGDVAEYQYYLALCLNQQGDIKRSSEILLDAHKLLDRIVRLNPTDHRFRFQLASNYSDLGKIQREEAQDDQASEFFERSLGILSQLVREEPDIARYQRKLAELRLELSRLSESSDDLRDAANYVESSLQIYGPLVLDDGENPFLLSSYAEALTHAGFVRKRLGDKSKSKSHFQNAQLAWKQVLQELPEDSQGSSGLTWVEDQLKRS
ncbi:MAG: hypothetical protein AAF191_16000, partial [Verrucomicrobiota bacterium]